MNAVRFGNHIIIKAPDDADERQRTVSAFRTLAKKHDVTHMGDTILLATARGQHKDDAFIQFAKARHLPYVDMPLSVDPIEAIKKARRFFGLD